MATMQISIYAQVMQKMSAVSVFEEEGIDRAIHVYPDYRIFLIGLEGANLELVRKQLLQELKKSKTVH